MTPGNYQRAAKTYAEAIYALAVERQAVDEVTGDLRQIAEFLAPAAPLQLFLESPAIGVKDKQAVMERIFQPHLHPLVGQLLGVMARKERLNVLRYVCPAFEDVARRHSGVVEGTLTTAVALAAREQARLQEQLGRILKTRLALRMRVDPDILGGMVLLVGDTLMDTSVRGRLKTFRRHFQTAFLAGMPGVAGDKDTIS